MSFLPQHKKSTEELAKLRESLGIHPVPDSLPATPAVPQVVSEAPSETGSLDRRPPASSILDPHPAPEIPVKQVRSLRRSDRSPVVPVENDQKWSPENESTAVPMPSAVPVSPGPRAIHSLRKSEQLPLSRTQSPAPDSNLPIHRHSPEEIREIRRQEVLAMQKLAFDQVSQKAHWIIIAPGYLFALAAIVGCYYYQIDIGYFAGCLAISFFVSGYLLIRKLYSRHHAAFIGVMSLLISVFGILYYFPQFRYGA